MSHRALDVYGSKVIPLHSLRLRRLGIDTYRELVIYLRSDSTLCRSEGFEAESRVE